MKIKDIIAKYPEAKDVEIYEIFGNREYAKYYTDTLKSVYEWEDTDKVLDYELMDKERYFDTVMANGSITEQDICDSLFPTLVIVRDTD